MPKRKKHQTKEENLAIAKKWLENGKTLIDLRIEMPDIISYNSLKMLGKYEFEVQKKMRFAHEETTLFNPINGGDWPSFWPGITIPVAALTEKKRHLWIYGYNGHGRTSFLDQILGVDYYRGREKISSDAKVIKFDDFNNRHFAPQKLYDIINGVNNALGDVWAIVCSGRSINHMYSEKGAILHECFVEVKV